MNVAKQLTDQALKNPYKRAVVISDGKDNLGAYRYKHYTFIELEKRINQIANQLHHFGIRKGMRVLLFVKPSLDFSALAYAVFKLGAVAVLIDPGMGRINFLNAIKQVRPNALIGIPKVHFLRRLFPKAFSNISVFISTSRFGFFTRPLYKNLSSCSFIYDCDDTKPNDQAAILFTSGGTGIPKGVVYTHKMFIEQTKMLQDEFSLTCNDLDIPGFPLFALFTLSMGMTSCIPDMDPTCPAKACGASLAKNIFDQGATFVAGSPAIWKNLLDYCLKNKISLPTVKYLVMFGAPIEIEMHKQFSKILPNGTTFTPYGATECLPICNISGAEILKSTAKKTLEGRGVCVGYPLANVNVKIIPRTNDVIESFSDLKFLPNNEVGEIIVNSPTVTKEYFLMPEKTKEAKIYDDTNIWHRMGDVGYIDHNGMLWFCGRKSHVVIQGESVHYTIPNEIPLNNIDDIQRTALVNFKNTSGMIDLALVVQMVNGKEKLSDSEKLNLQNKVNTVSKIKIDNIYFKSTFPLDVRHNIKIDRLKLGEWVNEQQ